MNIVSFCLYGKDKLYRIGAIKNVELCKIFYPGWVPWIYCSPSIDKETLYELKKRGAKIFVVEEDDSAFFMTYRFLPCATEEVGRVIFRDTDSRIDKREAAAVSEWIKHDTSLHIMRDHPWHIITPQTVILGGMWGVKADKLRDIKDIIFKYSKTDKWGTDQRIIAQEIYPRFINDKTVHDEIYSNCPFPLKRDGYKFIGCQYNENDEPIHPDHLEMLKKFLQGEKVL
jgi:hypothetical protein